MIISKVHPAFSPTVNNCSVACFWVWVWQTSDEEIYIIAFTDFMFEIDFSGDVLERRWTS